MKKMIRVKKEFIGKILKKGGITIVLTENTKQATLKFVESRFGDKFTEHFNETETEAETKTENETQLFINDYSAFDEYSLKELREEYPNIKAVSKKDFIDQIYDNN